MLSFNDKSIKDGKNVGFDRRQIRSGLYDGDLVENAKNNDDVLQVLQ